MIFPRMATSTERCTINQRVTKEAFQSSPHFLTSILSRARFFCWSLNSLNHPRKSCRKRREGGDHWWELRLDPKELRGIYFTEEAKQENRCVWRTEVGTS